MADNKNPIENNIAGKSVILIIAIALSLAVPMGVSMFSEENVDTKPVTDNSEITLQVSEKSKNADVSEKEESKEEITEISGYYMEDIYKLENVDYFASGTIEHIFDGTINGSVAKKLIKPNRCVIIKKKCWS